MAAGGSIVYLTVKFMLYNATGLPTLDGYGAGPSPVTAGASSLLGVAVQNFNASAVKTYASAGWGFRRRLY